MLLDGVAHRLENVAVLDDVVEAVRGRDIAGGTAVIRPKRIPVLNLLPLVKFLMVGVDVLAFDLGKIFCGFVEFV